MLTSELGNSPPHLESSFQRRMRRKSRLGVIGIGIACALLSLIVGTVILARQMDAASESIAERGEIGEQIRQMQNIMVLLADAESGQRGYLLTGNREYLASYERTVKALPASLDILSVVAADDASLREHIGSLGRLVRNRLKELAETVRLQNSGARAEALDVVQTGAGQDLMHEIRGHLEIITSSLIAQRAAADARVVARSAAIKRWAVITAVALALCLGTATLQLRTLAASRTRYERALAAQTSVLNVVIDEIPSTLAVWDRDLNFRLVNKAFERWRGKSRRLVVGKSFRQVLGEAEYENSVPWLARALNGETVTFEKVYPDAKITNVAVTYSPLVLDGGEIGGVIALVHDISEHRAEHERLQQLSERDPLTGLLNRIGFETSMGELVSGDAAGTLALLYIDLDHFKPVNDSFGHTAGDEVLRTFGQRIQALVRPTDLVARLGGDEFAIAVPGIRSELDAQRIAEQVVKVAAAPIAVGARTVTIGASVGVAVGAAPTGNWQELMERADVMVYQAKKSGRGRVGIDTRSS
jgi:diguanylate cyclase (GGDEF)-like protein/PAS domain S-box-containing protein